MAHLYGANTFCSYFASHNKMYPEWHAPQNKFRIFKMKHLCIDLERMSFPKHVEALKTSRFQT